MLPQNQPGRNFAPPPFPFPGGTLAPPSFLETTLLSRSLIRRHTDHDSQVFHPLGFLWGRLELTLARSLKAYHVRRLTHPFPRASRPLSRSANCTMSRVADEQEEQERFVSSSADKNDYVALPGGIRGMPPMPPFPAGLNGMPIAPPGGLPFPPPGGLPFPPPGPNGAPLPEFLMRPPSGQHGGFPGGPPPPLGFPGGPGMPPGHDRR